MGAEENGKKLNETENRGKQGKTEEVEMEEESEEWDEKDREKDKYKYEERERERGERKWFGEVKLKTRGHV